MARTGIQIDFTEATKGRMVAFEKGLAIKRSYKQRLAVNYASFFIRIFERHLRNELRKIDREGLIKHMTVEVEPGTNQYGLKLTFKGDAVFRIHYRARSGRGWPIIAQQPSGNQKDWNPPYKDSEFLAFDWNGQRVITRRVYHPGFDGDLVAEAIDRAVKSATSYANQKQTQVADLSAEWMGQKSAVTSPLLHQVESVNQKLI